MQRRRHDLSLGPPLPRPRGRAPRTPASATRAPRTRSSASRRATRTPARGAATAPCRAGVETTTASSATTRARRARATSPSSGFPGAVSVAAGQRHTCAATAAGAVFCWGADDAGQLGDGGGDSRALPVAVAGISTAIAVTAGEAFSCARAHGRHGAVLGRQQPRPARRRRRPDAEAAAHAGRRAHGHPRALGEVAARVRAARRRDALVLGRQQRGPARRRLVRRRARSPSRCSRSAP